MRRFLLLLFVIAGLVIPSLADVPPLRPLTITQLGHFLAGANKLTDLQLARDIDGFVLTERLNALQLLQWQSNLPGRRSREALTALADASVLLPPPPASVLTGPAPDAQTQADLLARAKDYVARTLTKLPDFSALRTTQFFDDTPPANSEDSSLHLNGLSTVSVSYSNGVEKRGAEKEQYFADKRTESGLATAGEFGPILSVVLDDAARGSMKWAYWEQGSQGRLAVFHYAVPQRDSSYVLTFTHAFHRVSVFPAYFGEIAIDPATGAILRISMLTSSLRAQDVLESAITVYYGSVQLGGITYICPLKGIALIRSLVDNNHSGATLRTQLNDTAFTGYHILRGDLRIVPDPQ